MLDVEIHVHSSVNEGARYLGDLAAWFRVSMRRRRVHEQKGKRRATGRTQRRKTETSQEEGTERAKKEEETCQTGKNG